MKIQLAEHYGLCFGVRDAIAQAERLAAQGPLTILGELVHNPVVRDRLAALGVKEGRLDDPDTAPTAQVMITAHGASDTDRAAWRSSGFGVADGTCPLVRHAHEQLRLLVQLGHAPVVIGRRGHVEVKGLMGDFPGTFILENEAQLAELPPAPSYGVVSQTTQPIEYVEVLVAALRARFPQSEVFFRDTVCQPTKSRQLALKKLLAECDTLVVVGGHNSNNTLQLVSAGVLAGLTVYHIERAEELCVEWFATARVTGLTAGTSTLRETVAAVQSRLEEIARAQEAAAPPPQGAPPSVTIPTFPTSGTSSTGRQVAA